MPETGRIGGDPGAIEEAATRSTSPGVISVSMQSAPRLATVPATKISASYSELPRSWPASPQTTSATGLAHERAHMPDRTADDNLHPLHRDAAARTGIALYDDEPAAARGGGGLRGVAAHANKPAHDVLSEPGAGMAIHYHCRRRVHAGAIVTDMPLDLDLHRLSDARPQWRERHLGSAPANRARWSVE